MSQTTSRFAGVWSATPTPLDERLNLDASSLSRLVEHHLTLGVRGLFLAGTAGEGPCMTDAQKLDLVRRVVHLGRGRLRICVQATDNSAERVLDQIRAIEQAGADVAVVAQPLFFMLPTERRIFDYYHRIFDQSPLPVGLYVRSNSSPVVLTPRRLSKLLRHPRVLMIKDSTLDPDIRQVALTARKRRPELALFSGDEFNCADYMLAGYDGLLLGGAIFNGGLAGKIIEAAQAGNESRARKWDAQIRRINHTAYGGPSIPCWLAGEKRLCMELGLFRTWSNYYGYTVTPACERAIQRLVRREGAALRGEIPWP